MGKHAAARTRRRKPPQPPQRKLLKIDGEPVPVTLKLNPRARQLIVRVHPSTGEVVVVAPSRRSLSHAMEFARKQSKWIAQRLENVPEPIPVGLGRRILYRGEEHVIRYGEPGRRPVWIERGESERIIRVNGRSEHAARRVLDFLKRDARHTLDARAMHYAEILDVRPARVTVRDTSSRWGSCSSTRNLSFSWRLILAPSFVLDYVVAHEVAHLREMNHGRRFWRLVEDLVGNVERPQVWLDENGAALHRYAPRMVTE
jgi:predicted metal-dependent hydrolase